MSDTRIEIVEYKNPEQAQALLELMDCYARDPMGGGEGLSDYVKRHLVEALAQRQDAISILAWHDQQPVGLINAFEGFSTFKSKPLLNIHDVIVHPHCRGQCIGYSMFVFLESYARQKNYCKLTLEVLSENAPAQTLYAKAGFTPYCLAPETGIAQFWQKNLDA